MLLSGPDCGQYFDSPVAAVRGPGRVICMALERTSPDVDLVPLAIGKATYTHTHAHARQLLRLLVTEEIRCWALSAACYLPDEHDEIA